MKYGLAGVLFLTVFLLFAACSKNAEGVRFERKSLRSLQRKAEKEEKLIFLNMSSSTCAPCRWMERKVFSLPEVGEFMNARFVSRKYDIYNGAGIPVRKSYDVEMAPTFLVLDSRGREIGRFTGKTRDAEEFIRKIRRIMEDAQ